MTPTREQVIEWAEEAGFVTGSFNSIDPDEVVTDGPRYITDEIERLCTLAMSAGRDQGLREAKEVCECKALASALAHVNTDEQAFHIKAEAARSCAAAIEQLRGK